MSIMPCELRLIGAVRSWYQFGLCFAQFVPGIPAIEDINEFECPHHRDGQITIDGVEHQEPPNDIENVQAQPRHPLLNKAEGGEDLLHYADDQGHAVPLRIMDVEQG